MARKLFNLQQIAALQAAGKPAADATEAAKAAAEAAAKTEAEAAAAQAGAAQAEAAQAEAEAAAANTEQKDPPAEQKAPAAKDEGVQAFLQAQIKDKDAQIVALTVELTTLKAQRDEQQATHQALLQIAAASASQMSVACGGAALDAKNLAATQVLAEHARLLDAFTKKFPVGGVAAVDAAAEAKEGDGQALSAHLARVKAVR